MSILSGKEILNFVTKEKSLLISPFDEKNLNAFSYDLTLGFYFYRIKIPSFSFKVEQEEEEDYYLPPVRNPFDKFCNKETFGDYQFASPLEDLQTFGFTLTNSNKIEENGILLRPKETILCHSEEFVGCLPSSFSFFFTGNNDLQLNLIQINTAWFDNNNDIKIFRIPFEVTNQSETHSVILITGKKIGSLCFFKREPFCNLQTEEFQQVIESSIKNWNPTFILPTFGKPPPVQSNLIVPTNKTVKKKKTLLVEEIKQDSNFIQNEESKSSSLSPPFKTKGQGTLLPKNVEYDPFIL